MTGIRTEPVSGPSVWRREDVEDPLGPTAAGAGAADDVGAPPDPLPDERGWRALSVLPRKRRDYAEDLHFRECWWTWTSCTAPARRQPCTRWRC